MKTEWEDIDLRPDCLECGGHMEVSSAGMAIARIINAPLVKIYFECEDKECYNYVTAYFHMGRRYHDPTT